MNADISNAHKDNTVFMAEINRTATQEKSETIKATNEYHSRHTVDISY